MQIASVAKRVLFIGNSLTFWNQGVDVMVKKLVPGIETSRVAVGGGGGVIKQIYDGSPATCSVYVSGGSGGCGASSGSTGIDSVSSYDLDGDGYTSDDGDCDPVASDVYPGAPETWYDGIDSDCSGGSDYDQDGDGHDSRQLRLPGLRASGRSAC